MKQQLKQLVYSAFKRAWEEEHNPDDVGPETVFVTEITQCLRKSYFQRKYGFRPAGEKAVILMLGSALHYIVQKYSDYDGKLVEVPVKAEFEGVELKGRVDLLLDDSVVELKTVIKVPDSVLEHHRDQLLLYMFMSGRERGYVVYVGKKDGAVEAYEVQNDPERLKTLLSRAKKLSQHLMNNEKPDPEPSWLCRFCEYRRICGVKT